MGILVVGCTNKGEDNLSRALGKTRPAKGRRYSSCTNIHFTFIRFEAYINKSAYKMAGLIHCCQANAVLGGANPTEAHKALLYGRHLGIAYQLVDDILDFVSLDDLKLGFATAPVLFAAEEFPQLHTMITRRLSTC